MAYSSDEEIDLAVLSTSMPRRARFFTERRFDVQSTWEFRERYRVPEPVVDFLEERFSDDLKHKAGRNNPLSARQQLLTFLHFLGTNSFYHVVQDCHGIGRDTVNRIIHKVIPLIFSLKDEIVHWPGNNLEIAEKFLEISEIPCVSGALDGSHVLVSPPAEDEASYVNRHHTHSLNVLVVCGPDLYIYFCSTKAPGNWHDSRVLRQNDLWATFEERGERPFPHAVLLGDSAYPCNDWLITPYPGDPEGARMRFNKAHRKGRNVIERCFGFLKQRFRSLMGGFRVRKMSEAAEAIQCAVILHNLCLKFGDDGGDLEIEEQQPVIDEAEVSTDARYRGSRRDELMNVFV